MLSTYIYDGHGPEYEIEIGSRGDFYGFDPRNIKFDTEFGLDDLIILIGMVNKKSRVMAGGIWVFDEPILGRFKHAIVIHSMREFTEEEMRKSVVSTSFVTTFEHEFIHVLDNRRTNNKIGNSPDPHDQTAYYNDDGEFNAFYHTVAQTWLWTLKGVLQEPEYAKDYIDLANMTGDFSSDLKRLMNATDQGSTFFKRLTPRNHKRIIGRLYQLHREIMASIH